MKTSLHFTCSLTVLLSTIVVGACSSDSAKTAPADTSGIHFELCDNASGMECGEFEVPLIHDSTDNRKISIDVARLPGTGEGPHEPLLLNIDAPGPGIEVLRDLARSGTFPAAIRERFDIIGLNQRGLSDSLKVDCGSLGDFSPNAYPRDQNEITNLVTNSSLLADACFAQFGDNLQWLGSNAVVQDMEIMRLQLNAPKLNIIGASFGTRVAALYLQRFPESSGRIVLDAPLPPAGSIDPLLLDTAEAQQRSFEQVLNTCGTVIPECDRSAVERAFVARVNTLLDSGDTETFNAFFQLLSLAIDESETGELLAPLLIDYALSGDPDDMFTLIRDPGLDQDDEETDGLTLERAVQCADDAARPTVESLVAKLGALNETSNFFAEAILPIGASCIGWPVATQPVVDIRTSDAPAPLVIGGTGDVNTPINWAAQMADAIGGVFLSSSHQGHTTVFTRENDCVDKIVADFLLEGTMPPTATSCD